MSRGRLVCIVEGDGEVGAVPALVRRILTHLRRERRLDVDAARTICAKCGDRITQPFDRARQIGIEFFVERAAREKPAGILVVVDAEERCVKRSEARLPPLGPALRDRAAQVAGGIPVGVVVANRMFESWFLADFHSLRARGHLPRSARLPRWQAPEELGGCKGILKDLLGRTYSETRDQIRFAEHLSLPLTPRMRSRAPSLWKLFREVDKLSRAARTDALPHP